jgi:predicted DNA-binding transcriptional regulator AlpA
MGKTSIEWAEHTWNPVRGCSRVFRYVAHCAVAPFLRHNAQMAKTNYDDWLPMGEVIKATGMSERTIYRQVTMGRLKQAQRPIPGRRPLPVFDREDVQRLAESILKARPEIMPPGGAEMALTAPNQTGELLAAMQAMILLHQEVLTLLRQQPAMIAPAAAGSADALFLSIQEACRFTGLSAATIQAAARAGKVARIGRKYRRKDLETL